MPTPNDGGPAFPTDSEHQPAGHVLHTEGMSLRDYFAGQIVVAAIATPVLYEEIIRAASKTGVTSEALIARLAYGRADAMLAEREKETKP